MDATEFERQIELWCTFVREEARVLFDKHVEPQHLMRIATQIADARLARHEAERQRNQLAIERPGPRGVRPA